MSFWLRVKQLQLRGLSNQLKRCYFSQFHGGPSTFSFSSTKIMAFADPHSFLHNTHFQSFNPVRFFAVPAQFKMKLEEKEDDGPRLNDSITAQYVRLVTDDGHSVVSRTEALERARALKLDLVEVQRDGKPPVCKIMDYHKEKYVKEQKEKERSKGKSEVALRKGVCKEVRFEGKIEQKDLQMKADHAKRLMDNGYRVKCVARGNLKKGKVDEDEKLGEVLARFYALIEDVAILESGPLQEKKLAYVIVRHVKFGPSKKGSKKAFILKDATSQVEEESTSVESDYLVSQSPVPDSSTLESYEREEAAPVETENRYKKKEQRGAAPAETENRYKKKEQRSSVPDPRSSQTGFPIQDAQPQQFPNQGRQPQQYPNQGAHPQQYPNQGRQPQQYPNQGRQPQQYPNHGGQPQQYPNQGRQPQQYPNQGRQPQQYANQGGQPQQYPNQVRQPRFDSSTSQEPSRSGASNYPNHNRYGMSSAPKAAEGLGAPTEVNRYKKAANPNSSAPNSYGNRRPDFDNGRQGR